MIDTACNASVHSSLWKRNYNEKTHRRVCFQGMPKPKLYFVARCNRKFAGLGGEDAATCIGRCAWLLALADAKERALNARPASSNEVSGQRILCLFGIDLQRRLNLFYVASVNRCFVKENHGPLKGEIVEIPVCACRGSLLRIVVTHH